MNKSQIDNETAMFIVLSDLGIDGPFFTLARAVELAEVADGVVYRLEPLGAAEEMHTADPRRMHHA
jgi:hypothetical protein